MSTFINPDSKVTEAITAISRNERPVTSLNNMYFVLDISAIGRRELLYTAFTADGQPIASYEAKYSAKHTVRDILLNPVPKKQLPNLLTNVIPESLPIIPVSDIIAGYL